MALVAGGEKETEGYKCAPAKETGGVARKCGKGHEKSETTVPEKPQI